MDYATTFYVLGGALAALAVLTSLAALRFESFPGRMAPLVVLAFVALVGAATTFAVLNGQDEEEARASETEKAGERIEREEESPIVEGEKEAGEEEAAPAGEAAPEGETAPQQAPEKKASEKPAKGGAKAAPGGASKPAQKKGGGPGGTLQLAADKTAIAFDTTTLESKPGKVTIDFDNPSALEHDVAIEKDGKQIAVSETIAEGSTSVSAELSPGTYTFLCTVPGHAEAGMEGTLTVK